MAKLSQKYETVLVVSTAGTEEETAAIVEKFKALIAENGTITNVDDWGKRRLAYPINDELEGHYVLIQFESKPEFPAELDRIYKITDGLLRSLIVTIEE